MRSKYLAAKIIFCILFIASGLVWLHQTSKADTGASALEVSAPQEAIPPNIAATSNKPMLMLATSKDHTLFSPIYTDFEDLDGDGIIETDFKPNFKYYGYFDSVKCYIYSKADGRFNPHSMSIITSDKRMTCPHTDKLWSGNFLNWATMSRLDVVRKMLYGGKRYIDGKAASSSVNSVTVLERANLSQDSHSFTKTYFGTDIRDYTPFNPTAADGLIRDTGDNANIYAGLTICNRSTEQSPGGEPVLRIVPGNYKLWAHIAGKVCRWYGDENNGWFDQKISEYFKKPTKGNGPFKHETWLHDPHVLAGIDAQIYARVRVCDPLLLGEERCQPYPVASTNNYKPIGIFQEFGTQPSANSAVRAEIGVIMGSYDHNLSSGVLRKNIEDFSNEINPDDGIFCHSASNACPTTGPLVYTPGAIKAFDTIQLVGREGNYKNDTDYWTQVPHAFTPAQLPDGFHPAWGNPLGEMVTLGMRYFAGVAEPSFSTTSSTWDSQIGMPVAAWKDPFRNDPARTQKFGPAACRPMYVMALSSNALSFDSESKENFETLPNRKGTLKQYTDWIGVNEKITGEEHGLRSVGSTDGSFGDNCTLKKLLNLSDATGICPESAGYKGTWQMSGTAFHSNTAKIRDMEAIKAQNQLPADIGLVEDALKVKTISASLQGGTPRIDVKIPNSNPAKYVYITLESLWGAGGEWDSTTQRYEGGDVLPGGLLSFVGINAGERYGTFVVSWNDRPFGGDYDMDITGFLRYDILDDSQGGYELKITTDVLQVTSGMTGTHGYSVMGTGTDDGRYLTHTHGHVVNEKLRNAPGNLCKDKFFTAADRDEGRPGAYYYNTPPKGTPHHCNVSWGSHDVFNVDLPYTKTFKMVGVNDVLIQDPLWYATKYGYTKSSTQQADGTYTDLTPQELMDKIAKDPLSWDNLKADGTPGSDGIPDGYILARRPELLEAQLRKMLEALATTSNAAAALSASALADGVYKYSVQFDSQSVTGKLEAYRLNDKGVFGNTPLWEAGKKLKDRAAADFGASREIITNNGPQGVPFRWSSLSTNWVTQLTTASTNRLSTANAQATLNYVRGNQRDEGTRGLRSRGESLLGPIVNSTPWVQQRPTANWGPAPGYSEFYEKYRQREKLLWLGANDGMLHAFNATTGDEVLAYVPAALANRVAEIPLQRNTLTRLGSSNFVTGSEVRPAGTVWPYVDGNPFTADVKVANDWYTYAFGSLGRGGRGVFALNATTVGDLREANASQVFRWQFTAADDVDLGYQVGDIKLQLSSNQASPIAQLNNGKFAWIMGNGQLSRSGKAALFIVYVDGPAADGNWTGRYQKLVVDAGTNNGLSSPRWEDLDGNGTADVVYAGDLKGNLWKFDLNSPDPALWSPAFGGQATAQQPLAIPLFTASYNDGTRTVVQPITTAPELIYMGAGGVVVNFGTGNGFRQGDFGGSTGRQSVYGIWDREAPLVNPKLLVRSYRRQSDGAVVASSNAAMSWGSDGYAGWRVDLPEDGEAVLTDPSYDTGVFSFVSTRSRTGQLLCNTAPQNSLYMLDPISGKPERLTQGHSTLDGVEVLAAARDIIDPKVRIVADRRPPPQASCKEGDPGCTCTGASCQKAIPRCMPGQRALSAQGRGTEATICYSVAPRMHWREIPGVRTYPD